jgi:hypothetical protein
MPLDWCHREKPWIELSKIYIICLSPLLYSYGDDQEMYGPGAAAADEELDKQESVLADEELNKHKSAVGDDEGLDDSEGYEKGLDDSEGYDKEL